MKVLFDLVHPADALFFFHPMRMLEADGVQTLVVSRRKDVLVPLLDDLGVPHRPLTSAGRGIAGLAAELLVRDVLLWREVRDFRPDVLVGFGGVSISHVGKMAGTPSIAFYDTEHAALQIRLALPFISEWHVPNSWRGLEAPRRTFRFAGGKQFAFIHPDYFRPDEDRARRAGWMESQDNFVVRVVTWKASHDWGRSGLAEDRLRRAVDFLSARGRVHISAEGPLPADLEQYRYRHGLVDFHHLLARCRLFFGESITVASEAVAHGVPSVVQIDKNYGYVREQSEAGLIEQIAVDTPIEDALDRVLSRDLGEFRQRALEYMAGAGDINKYVVSAIKRLASPGSEVTGR